MKVEQIKLEKIIPYANNSRTHSDEQVAQIAASIRQFGFNNPVLIDEDTTIIAGHGRVLAASRLGLEVVPCIRLNHLSESQKKAYIIADNKIALNSGWDEELLRLELEGLTDAEQVATGFTADEINLLFNAWTPNIEIPDHSDMDTRPVLRFKIEKDQEEFAKEIITNALDTAGVEYERF
jgi:ParB-like chromosome segregation protein Spo0J